MATEVKDLPIEVIAKIFSFLNEKEISKLSIVCSKFNTAAKDPSLWRRCEINFHDADERKISSFCNFFSENPHLRVLSIRQNSSFSFGTLSFTSVNSFNNLFENLNNLVCLNIEINLTNIFLPPSLKHLTCQLHSKCYDDQFSFLEKCPQIERLYLKAISDYGIPNAVQCVRFVLLKYQMTLKAFYVKVKHFEREWIPLISRCMNLKELGLQLAEGIVIRPDQSKLLETLSSRLEVLYVNSISTSRSFCNFEFPELKHLTVDSKEYLMDFLPLIKQMPKLESLCFSGNTKYPSDDDFRNFVMTIKGCETLKYLETDCLDFSKREKDYTDIIREANEGSNNKCWNVSYTYISKNRFLMSEYMCSCWTLNPAKKFEKSLLGQKHHQLLLVNTHDDDKNWDERGGSWGGFDDYEDFIDDYFEQYGVGD